MSRSRHRDDEACGSHPRSLLGSTATRSKRERSHNANLRTSPSQPTDQARTYCKPSASSCVSDTSALDGLDTEDIRDRHEQESDRTIFDKFYTPDNGPFYAKSPYEPLDLERQELRVARVFPRKSLRDHFVDHPKWDRNHVRGLDSNIQLLACEIENTALSRIDGQYSTLSYVAGNLKDTELMLVNGIPFNAFMNLGHAIECVLIHSHASDKDNGCMLWLDQICINQSDKKELGHQVQFMREIYRRSENTFVCLSTPKALECLSWIPRIAGHSARVRAVPGQDTEGVIALKNILLDLSVGENLGGILRPSMREQLRVLQPEPGIKLKPRVTATSPPPELTGSQASPSRDSSAPEPSSAGIYSSRTTAESLPNHNLSDGIKTKDVPSAESFQRSLWEFMTNKWWRR